MLVSRVVVAFPTLFVFIFIGGLSSNSVAKVQDVVSEEVANLKSPSVDIRIDAAKSLSKSNSPGSSTSHGRICCSIMLKRASSMSIVWLTIIEKAKKFYHSPSVVSAIGPLNVCSRQR